MANLSKISIQVFTISIILLANLQVSGQSLSDTLKIDEVKVVAGNIIKKEEAGVVKSTIDSLAVAKYLDANLSELIAVSTPLFIKNYGRGAMATASFRGTAPSHTQVRWNGINLNSPMLGMTDFSTIPVYFIDDVSLLHGAGSISETGGALGGSIKLETNAKWDNRFSGTVISGIGSYSTFNEFLQINIGNKKLQLKTRVFYNSSLNNYKFRNKTRLDYNDETGEFIRPIERNENARYENTGVLQEIFVRPNEKNIISAKYWFHKLSRGIPKLLTNESATYANINHQNEKAHRIVADWNRYGNKSKFTLRSGVNLQKSNYILTTVVSGGEDQVPFDSWSETSSFYNNAKYIYNISKNFSATIGLNADYHSVNSSNTEQGVNTYGYNVDRLETSLYFQISKQFGYFLSTNFTGRQNYYDSNAAPFIPVLGIKLKPIESSNLTFNANIAKNNHQPTLNDLYYIPGGNPDLLPENSSSYDIGISYNTNISNSTISFSLNRHKSKIDDWIIWLPTFKGNWRPQNVKQVNVDGIESNLKVEGKIGTIDYKLYGMYALNNSINNGDPRNWADESIGKQLPFIPLHSANIHSSLSKNGFHITHIWNYYSERFTTSSNNTDEMDKPLYAIFMNNLYIGKKWQEEKFSFDIELKIYNMLNEEYRTILQRLMPRRNYMLLLRINI